MTAYSALQLANKGGLLEAADQWYDQRLRSLNPQVTLAFIICISGIVTAFSSW